MIPLRFDMTDMQHPVTLRLAIDAEAPPLNQGFPMMPRKALPSRRPVPPAGDSRRNLVLVRSEGYQQRRDFEAIRDRITAQAPDIVTTIVDSEWPHPGIERILSRLPTLIVSPTSPGNFRPERGRLYFGRPISKTLQYEMLKKARLPTPETMLLKPGIAPDRKRFGDFVVLKPSEGELSRGVGVSMMRTERLRYVAPADYPEGHPGRQHPMVAQQFIDTGPRPAHYRVLTLCGEPLYAVAHQLVQPRADLDAGDDAIEASTIATNGGRRTRRLIDDADVLDLARKVDAAAPGIPLKGTDLLRDVEGKLWVLEINGGGNTWHFSSDAGLELRCAIAEAAGITEELSEAGRTILLQQFGALDRAAAILIAKTRAEAQ